MDQGTAAALRAVLSGLRKSGAISNNHVEAVVRELEKLDVNLGKVSSPDRYPVRCLCMDVAADAGVDTEIKSPEPNMDWRH